MKLEADIPSTIDGNVCVGAFIVKVTYQGKRWKEDQLILAGVSLHFEAGRHQRREGGQETTFKVNFFFFHFQEISQVLTLEYPGTGEPQLSRLVSGPVY